MKILVTGGSGFIGSHLVEALVGKDYEVVCLVRESDDISWIKDLKIKYVYGDVTDKNSLKEAVKGVDYVYHLAAAVMAKNYEGYHRVNCNGTKNLVETCIESGQKLKRFLFVSSVAAGGPSGDDRTLTEESQGNPISDYGRTKLETEKYLESIGDKLPFTVIRLPLMYGPRDRSAIYSFFVAIKKGIKPLIGKGISNICYVKDAVKAMILASERDIASGRMYLAAQRGLFTRREIVSSVEKAMDKKAVVLKVPISLCLLTLPVFWVHGKITGRIPLFTMRNYIDLKHCCWKYSTQKIEKELDFTAEYELERGMKLTLEWYRQNKYL